LAHYFENPKRNLQAKELVCFSNEEKSDCKARLEGMGWVFPPTAAQTEDGKKWVVEKQEEIGEKPV